MFLMDVVGEIITAVVCVIINHFLSVTSFSFKSHTFPLSTAGRFALFRDPLPTSFTGGRHLWLHRGHFLGLDRRQRQEGRLRGHETHELQRFPTSGERPSKTTATGTTGCATTDGTEIFLLVVRLSL